MLTGVGVYRDTPGTNGFAGDRIRLNTQSAVRPSPAAAGGCSSTSALGCKLNELTYDVKKTHRPAPNPTQ